MTSSVRALSTTAGGRIRVSLSPRDIPRLETSMMELLQIANDPDVSSDRLEQVIARDQALTLRLLTVANSSYYGCSRKIDSVRNAIALLGTRQVQNIASAMALAPAFDSHYGPELWAHGLATALWTRHVVRALGTPSIDYLFTTALLHDIGIVLLLRNVPDQEHACLEEARDTGRSIDDVEREWFGIDHARLGARACAAWKLPERIIELVATHHTAPDASPGTEVDRTVLMLADVLVARTGRPEIATEHEPPWPDAVLAALGLSSSDVDALLSQSEDVAAEASAFD